MKIWRVREIKEERESKRKREEEGRYEISKGLSGKNYKR